MFPYVEIRIQNVNDTVIAIVSKISELEHIL